MAALEGVSSAPSRIAAIDALRGAALAAMFSYHFIWDLGYFGFIPGEFPQQPGFKDYGHAIASTFLVLVGVSLVLAQSEKSTLRHFFVRLGKIAAAAALVTIGTYFFAPDELIFFGILHCIVLASLAALLFLRAPPWLTFAVAVVVIVLPLFVADPFFNAPALLWLGLGTIPPQTLDWRPFLPWSGVVLLGVAFARALPPDRWPPKFVAWTARAWPARSLVWGGRHSLFVYLVHQPIFLALLYVAAQISGVKPETAEAPFLRNCQSQCTMSGATPTYCGNVCRCIVVRAQGSDLWSRMTRPNPGESDQERFRAVTSECARDERPPEFP